MERIRVVSKKYDGSLRDEYEAYLAVKTAESITLFSPPGQKQYDHRKAAWVPAPDGLIEIYFKHRWYNVWHICEQVSHTNLIYVNIALPAAFQLQLLVWTDLDLDYRVHLDGRVEKLDQEEFKHNRDRMGYSQQIIEQVGAACLEVEMGLLQKRFPFDHERQAALYQRLNNSRSV